MGDNSLPGDSIEAADFAGLTLSEPGMTRERKHADIQLEDPVCHGMEEVPGATEKRSRVLAYLRNLGSKWEDSGKEDLDSYLLDSEEPPDRERDPEGLVDSGSSSKGAVTEEAPSVEECLHAHRSQPPIAEGEDGENEKKKRKQSEGWWGTPSGPVAKINERAVALFWKIMDAASWRNLHWLPHQVLVYEVRVREGYGMRWSQDHGSPDAKDSPLWVFRGFVEPMMENGHELGWKHAE
ncbi:ProFAR isomerase associated family protein [Coprinopsis cinerea okayama7|uniref:ProFAR isomerase associated family protein n=1 Tax=Coprinopsis cinerea (strain Okayama-7 / 130 / ATCC MYA-4618 / FGSC 9003) TaxID=240176 RepID=A8NNB0_COPC7|nr:ProFAR isomerase associated family protein [Coprinopsis cinerea okayama7\|eukprot:XP_001835087.2 ProFAR isomerase associated family protein [Coprinopsis cinerea okayama7\